MNEVARAGVASLAVETPHSAVSWGAVIAGAVVAAALTLLLSAFGVGIGLSTISPWPGEGVSATTFKIGSGIYLICTAIMASALGGYMTGRLRTKWASVNPNAVYFRDTAHGFLTWALALLLGAAVLGGVATHLTGAGLQGAGQAAGGAAPQAISMASQMSDRLLRPAPGRVAPASTAGAPDNRGEFVRLFAASLREGTDLSTDDRTYLAQAVATRTGLTPQEAEQRVNAVITDARAAADRARKATLQLSLWIAAAMVAGAFAASLAALEGGQMRDGVWRGTRVYLN